MIALPLSRRPGVDFAGVSGRERDDLLYADPAAVRVMLGYVLARCQRAARQERTEEKP